MLPHLRPQFMHSMLHGRPILSLDVYVPIEEIAARLREGYCAWGGCCGVGAFQPQGFVGPEVYRVTFVTEDGEDGHVDMPNARVGAWEFLRRVSGSVHITFSPPEGACIGHRWRCECATCVDARTKAIKGGAL